MEDLETIKRASKDDSVKIWQKFNYHEVVQITHVPLIISEMAWIYAEKVIDYCVSHRISRLKKASRMVRDVRRDYYYELRKDINQGIIDMLRKDTEENMAEMRNDFLILWISVKNELMRLYHSEQDLDMVADATIAYMMVQFFQDHNRRMDQLIASKMKGGRSIDNRFMNLLKKYMKDYFICDCAIDYNQHLDNWIKAFEVKVKDIECDLVDEEDFDKAKKEYKQSKTKTK